jgi:hypothetical protein
MELVVVSNPVEVAYHKARRVGYRLPICGVRNHALTDKRASPICLQKQNRAPALELHDHFFLPLAEIGPAVGLLASLIVFSVFPILASCQKEKSDCQVWIGFLDLILVNFKFSSV